MGDKKIISFFSGSAKVSYDVSDDCEVRKCDGKVKKYYARIYRCTKCGEFKYIHDPTERPNLYIVQRTAKDVPR